MDRLTLLVFGDNTAVLELIENTLRQRGHRVLATNKSNEVLEIGRRIRIDLLISDVVPGGPALARQLVEIQPSLKVLCLLDGDETAGAVDDADVFLRKPVVLGELEAAVAAALDR